MWLFVAIFFGIACCYTVINLSLADKSLTLWFGIALLALCSVIAYPFSLDMTNHTLKDWLQKETTISSIALIQIFESIALIFVSITQIKSHYNTKQNKYLSWVSIMPSIVFVIGIFFLQSFLFLNVERLSYARLGFFFMLGLVIILFFLSLLFKTLLRQWAIRAELKLLLSLFQILLAMFLPLVLTGYKISFSNLEIDKLAIEMAFGIMIPIIVIGFYTYYRKNKIKL